jgi:hypothetical protein
MIQTEQQYAALMRKTAQQTRYPRHRSKKTLLEEVFSTRKDCTEEQSRFFYYHSISTKK